MEAVLEPSKIWNTKIWKAHRKSLNLLRDCGYEIDDPNRRLIISHENCNLDVFLLRDDDIPHYILQGLCEFGIVGLNLLEEKFNEEINLNKLKIIQKLLLGGADFL